MAMYGESRAVRRGVKWRTGVALAGLGLLAACGFQPPEFLFGPPKIASQPVGELRPFASALQRAYLGYATAAYDRRAFSVSEFYARRSIMADGDDLPLPTPPIEDDARQEIAAAYDRLVAQFDSGARAAAPADTARAQAAYDCWIREDRSDGAREAADLCRTRTLDAVAALEAAPRFANAQAPSAVNSARAEQVAIEARRTLSAVGKAPVAVAAPSDRMSRIGRLRTTAGPTMGEFVVYFELGSTKLTVEARESLSATIAAIQTRQPGKVTLYGHTDRSGSARVNRRVSIRRAQAVQRYLRERFGAALAVDIIAMGEQNPAIDTADGVVEALNRRVEIALDSAVAQAETLNVAGLAP